MKAQKHFLEEYLIVVTPPNTICWDVKEMKYDFALKNGKYSGQHSKAHIILANALLTKGESKTLLNRLKRQLLHFPTFDIYTNGFDFFQESNTFYIDIAKNDQLEKLQKQVLEQLLLVKPQFTINRNKFTPHMTIGKQLSRAQFLDAYHTFSKKSYTNYFRIQDITILSRPLGEDKFEEEKYIPLKTEDWCVV